MKSLITYIIHIIRYLLAAAVLLFSVATLMGHSYVQTFLLWLLILALVYWPPIFKKNWGSGISALVRISTVLLLFIIGFMVFAPGPKESIYISEELRQNLMEVYDQRIMQWPEGTESIFIQTQYGKVHILACGDTENPPLVMIHAASMGAHSWAENLEPLLEDYRVYAIDNIGEGNKSELDNAVKYPESQQEIADHFASVMDALGIESAPLLGASNGGFVAMCYTHYYPHRVQSLALFGPMGLTQLSKKSFMMLSIASMYPFQFVRDRVTRWAIGDSRYVVDTYGEWFNTIMKATIPSVAEPVPMTRIQKMEMDLPVLLFLGTEDQLVGDVEIARSYAEDFPDIQIEILESSHIVAVEHAGYVNEVLAGFLDQHEGSRTEKTVR
jgi:pimeloyl-ACP methyl ester carboxylesterase